MQASLALPLSAFELRDAVRHARRFDPVRLDRVLRLDADRALLEVQASATWESVAGHLRSTAWNGYGTIGESIAANHAGPDGQPLVAHVESLALVTPDGELRRVSRDSHGELFALTVGGHGLFGALYSATLRIDSLARAASEGGDIERLVLEASQGCARPLQLLVPPEAAERFLAGTRALCEEWRTPIEAVEVRRTLPEGETALRWARREYAAIELTLGRRETIGASVRATQVRREIIDLAIALGGSFPIACTPEATRAQLEACYPELGKVLAEKRRIDPAEKLSNPWYLHHRNLLGRERCTVRWNA